ncbi:SGNH/GDSL hydrolase family protein [Streptomyces aquilus]|uniref:SGNH/GDSL hydrolase family protein n=1 Tax=Streptomyces aquilus TaxID=2548456 RepID=A0A3Q9BVM6_9ACTN|nr:SGNH/GDSL hydrolase family protein [Streptomyces aquilus]AZP15115.1 SGNH/GDSL hydrolase family protein [Streptomyces aquilus]
MTNNDVGPAKRQGRRDLLIWWGPRLLFLLGTLVLTSQSVRGVSASTLAWTLLLFALCSLAFVVRQLWKGTEAGAGDSAPRWLTWAGIGLSAAGAVILVLSLTAVEMDGLSLVGAVVLLLGLGWLVEWWRGYGTKLLPWGAGLVGGAGLIVVVGAFLLPGARGAWSMALLAALGMAFFVALPLGLNVLSAWGLRSLRVLRASGSGRTARRLSMAGAAVVAAAGAFVVWLVHADWVLTAVLAGFVVLLLLAIVSNTHADVALVLAGLCLLAAAPPEHQASDVLPAARGEHVLVALGDSYMSGEGAASYVAGTNDGGGDECRRAPSAYAVRAASRGAPFDGLVFLACSGARTFNVVGSADQGHARAQKGEPGTQIDQLEALGTSFRPALVILSIGGNDAGFSSVGTACIAPGDCNDRKSLFMGNLPSVRSALTETYRLLRRHLPSDVPVVAVPYPQPIADTRTCNGVALTKAERDFIRTFLVALNDTVESAAEEAGILYLAPMEDALKAAHLQLCDRRKAAAGINFLDVRSVSGLSTQRFNPGKWLHNSLHPNERGHEAMRAVFETWLTAHPQILGDASAEQNAADARATSVRAAVAEPEPPCSLAEITGTDCQLQLRDWEVRQVLNRWLLLFGVAVALLLVWLAGIAVVSLLPKAP